MASSTPSGHGGGDDKPPESALGDFARLDPPADPQSNGGSPASPPAPSSGDDDRSVMGMMEGPDRQAGARCGTKRPLLAIMRRCSCSACGVRKKMFRDKREARRRLDPPANPGSDGEFSALPSAPAPPSGDGKPVLGLGMELPNSRAQALGTKRPCPACELRKKMMLDKREERRRLDPPVNPRRNGEFYAPPPVPPPSSGDGKPVLGLGLGMELPASRARARYETKWPPLVQTRSCPACEVRKNIMFDKREGLRWDYQKLVLEVAGFGASAGGSGLREKMLDEREGMRGKLAQLQGAQEPSSSAAAGVDVLHEKMMHYEQGVLQDSTEFVRLLGSQVVGSSAVAGGGGPGGSHGGLNQEAMYKLVSQTKERMQDIIETVIPQLFSKEILYEPIKECVGRYPKWLEENKDKVKKEEYEQYQKQLDLMVNLTVVYDNYPENFSKIIKIMYKIGECGQPPSDIITDISPGLDPSISGQLFPGMLGLLHNVLGNPFSK